MRKSSPCRVLALSYLPRPLHLHILKLHTPPRTLRRTITRVILIPHSLDLAVQFSRRRIDAVAHDAERYGRRYRSRSIGCSTTTDIHAHLSLSYHPSQLFDTAHHAIIRIRQLGLILAQALNLACRALEYSLDAFLRLEARIGEGNVVRRILINESLQLCLTFGKSDNLCGVGLVDLLHACEAGGLGDAQGMNLLGIGGDESCEAVQLLGEAIYCRIRRRTRPRWVGFRAQRL